MKSCSFFFCTKILEGERERVLMAVGCAREEGDSMRSEGQRGLRHQKESSSEHESRAGWAAPPPFIYQKKII